MFARLAPRPACYRIPEGERVYAIGDVHGRLDLLDALLAEIVRDDESRTPAEATIVLLGDLVDRGPDSAGVIARARQLCADMGVGRLLKGNHDEVFARAAAGSEAATRALIRMGGMATVLSYGITREEAEYGGFDDLARLLADRIPREDVAFLEGGEDKIAIGDYLFVHAGIRPGVEIERQRRADLLWIRDEFLNHRRRHPQMIVHGHSVSGEVEVLANRIGIDTGAWETGRLSAIGLEGGERWVLAAVGEPAEQAAASDGERGASVSRWNRRHRRN